MVTSTALISDAGPAVNQQPVVTASVDASISGININNSATSTVPASGGASAVSSHLASSQSLPASLVVSSRMTSNDPRVVSSQALPSYIQANSSSSSSHPSINTTSASPRPQSPGYRPHQRPLNASLPDILNSHLGPSLRQNQHRPNRDRQRPRSHAAGDGAGAGASPARTGGHHGGIHRPRGERATRTRNRTVSTSSTQAQESGTCKEPCVKCVVTVTSFRWVLVLLSIMGVICVVAGIILAALNAVRNSFLFLAIMFIGLGVLLVVVVAVGWKCTPRGHEPIHALFRIGQFNSRRPRERRPRRHRNRDGNWFGGVLYPEFQYRRPPPSYAASMQDYNNQSLQELRTSGALSSGNIDSASLPSSPPPSYRSRTSTMHSTLPGGQTGDLPNSRPPTYRSRAPSRRPSLPRDERRETETRPDQGPADVEFTGPVGSEPATSDIFTVSSSAPSVPVGMAVVYAQSASSFQMPPRAPLINKDATQTSNLTPAQPAQQSLNVERNPSQDVVAISDQGRRSSITDTSPDNVYHQMPQSSLPSSNIGLSETVVPSSSADILSSEPSASIPSLHQRMKSQDREMLEKALQSLDDQIHAEEDGGHVNHGASFNDPEHMDTHL